MQDFFYGTVGFLGGLVSSFFIYFDPSNEQELLFGSLSSTATSFAAIYFARYHQITPFDEIEAWKRYKEYLKKEK